MYLNKAYVLGNLTRDPEMKAMPNGGKVTQFSLATNRIWKDQNGAKQEQVEYHNVVVFGRQAETSAEYLKKGQQVLIEGRIQTRSWDGTDGKKNYRTEIVADSVQFGSKTGGMTGGPAGAPMPTNDSYSAAPSSQSTGGGLETISYGDDEVNPDDIPF
jgi:single-strand DNA-binding protein